MADKIQLFGRSYNQLGDSNSDIILKTKGQIKIQWGSRYIDLIKDGKISTDSTFIFKVDNYSKIGVKDGIYIVNDQIYLKSGDSIISLLGEGNTYVSFMGTQNTTSDDKHNALSNIGLIYNSLKDINENSLQNGIIYIESEQKLYIVQNGVLSQYSIPNILTNQFTISKNDSLIGSLVIKGNGKENSILFNSMSIYDKNINITDTLNIKINDEDKIIINNQGFTSNIDIISDSIRSKENRINKGFKLYNSNGESTLEVDNLIIRNSKSLSNIESNTKVYPEYYLLNVNVISDFSQSENEINITLKYTNTYSVGDVLCTYDDNNNQYILTVTTTSSDSIKATSNQEIKDSLNENLIFLMQSEDENPIKIKSNNIDIIDNNNVLVRIGNLNSIDQSGSGICTNNLLLIGDNINKLPRYSESLNELLTNLDYSNNNDCVLVSVGLLKKVLNDSINSLNSKISTLEAEIQNIKKQLGN